MAWYRPLSRDVVFSWRLKGGIIFSPDVDVGAGSGAFIPPEQRFYAGGPNDVRGFERNELGTGGLRGAPRRSGLGRRAWGTGSTPTRCGLRPPAETPWSWATSRSGCPRRSSAPGSGSPRLSMPAGSGTGTDPSASKVIRVTPGFGIRDCHPARSRAARRGLQSVQAPARGAVSVRRRGQPDPGSGSRLVRAAPATGRSPSILPSGSRSDAPPAGAVPLRVRGRQPWPWCWGWSRR